MAGQPVVGTGELQWISPHPPRSQDQQVETNKTVSRQDIEDLKARHLAAVASCAAASQNLVDVRAATGSTSEDITAAASGYRTAEATMMSSLQSLMQTMQRYLVVAREAVAAPTPTEGMFFNAPDGSVQAWDPYKGEMRPATDEEVLALAKMSLGGQPG
jgi:hypothetical protein